MEIYGKKIGMRLTVGATAKIAARCPDGDLRRIGELFDRPFAENMDFIADFIVALNEGYVSQKKFESESCDRLGREEVLSLGIQDFNRLQEEAMRAFGDGQKSEVETVAKKNNGEEDEKSPSRG